MKILVLGSRIPWPLHDGGAIATFNLLKYLSSAGAEVTYFSYNTRKHFVSESEITLHFPFCQVVTADLDAGTSVVGAISALIRGDNYNISRFYNKNAFAKLRQLLQTNPYDLIQFEGLFSTPFFKTVSEVSPATPMAYRAHNVEYRIWEQLAHAEKNPLKRWYLKILATGLKKYETETIHRFKHIVPITSEDESLLKSINAAADYHVAVAGVDVPQITVSAEPQTLYHIGSMEWMPNREGLLWFCHEVFGEIKKEMPEATLHIAGKGLKTDDAEFKIPGIVNHGEVENAAAFHQKYGIMIVPLNSGSGLRIKTVEALALGKPVISTSVGASGLNCESGKHLMIADNNYDFATAALALLRNPSKAETLGKAGKAFVMIHYAPAAVADNLLKYYGNICAAV